MSDMALILEFPECHDSPLGRVDPRWKLAALVPAAAGVALLRHLEPALAALFGALLLIGMARVPWRWFLSRFGLTALFLGLFFIWLPLLPDKEGTTLTFCEMTISSHGLNLAAIFFVRGLALVTLAMVLVASSPVQETFKAAHGLHVPGLIVHLALLSYRYVFLLTDELGRLRTALRVRGYRNRPSMHCYRTVGQVAGTLLVRGHERAELVGQAMRCRGFDGKFRSLHEFHTTTRDVLVWIAIVSCAAALLIWDFFAAI